MRTLNEIAGFGWLKLMPGRMLQQDRDDVRHPSDSQDLNPPSGLWMGSSTPSPTRKGSDHAKTHASCEETTQAQALHQPQPDRRRSTQALRGPEGPQGRTDSRRGAVARFNPSASRAAFPTLRSRHHGVGLRPAELGHPVQDVTPDHGLSALRVAVPRLQASSEH